MSEIFKVSCLQTNTTDDAERNLKQIAELLEQAHHEGADLAALPEACDFLSPEHSAMKKYARLPRDHKALEFITSLAKKYQMHVLIGSLTVQHEKGTLANRSFLLSPQGEIMTHYDKIHMFDANIPGSEGSKESDLYNPGNQACLASLPWVRMGMTICYDVRFPHLYRSLGHSGAQMIAVPAAFAKMTGQAHWHTLLKARAIENGCFIIAPAQTGHHYKKRYSYGHSLIISPWGEILADAGEDVGVITHSIDLTKIADARQVINSIRHDRDFIRASKVE